MTSIHIIFDDNTIEFCYVYGRICDCCHEQSSIHYLFSIEVETMDEATHILRQCRKQRRCKYRLINKLSEMFDEDYNYLRPNGRGCGLK